MDKNKWAQMDIPPSLDIRFKSEKFETFEKMVKERQTRIRLLRESGYKWARIIAKILARCKKGRRCWIAACPVCMRSHRKWLFAQELRIFPDRKKTKIITLIIADRLKDAEELMSLSIPQMISRLRNQLRRTGFKQTFIIGGFEITWNIGLQRWVPHFHLIVRGSTKEARKKLRKSYYRCTNMIKRPMKVQPVINRTKQYSYCLKSYVTKSGKDQKKKATEWAGDRLNPFHHNLALRFMAQYQPQQTGFRLGVKREGDKMDILE